MSFLTVEAHVSHLRFQKNDSVSEPGSKIEEEQYCMSVFRHSLQQQRSYDSYLEVLVEIPCRTSTLPEVIFFSKWNWIARSQKVQFELKRARSCVNISLFSINGHPSPGSKKDSKNSPEKHVVSQPTSHASQFILTLYSYNSRRVSNLLDYINRRMTNIGCNH